MRDPRVDPSVGDEIARSIPRALYGIILRKVTRAHGGFVFCLADNGYATKPMIMTLADWRRWARNAEVVETAESVQVPK